jgi:alpha-1,6-mannosyltransferase
LLLATHSAFLLLFRRVSLLHILLPAGISAALFALFLTITIDSFFWQTPLWPEWTAFRFNTLEGHSSEWGTSPSYFYFLNALPKLLINPSTYLLCIPIALADRYARTQSIGLVAPNLAFITLYSLLPHKEWRFILYSVPPLTGVAAAGAAYIWVRRSRSWLFSLLALALVASTFVSFIASTGLLAISSMNYPGAAALGRLHDLAHGERPMIRVHLGNLACQTGVTRFLQKPAPVEVGMNGTVWHYDKSEIVGTPDDEARAFWERFDYVLVEREDEVVGRWEIVEVVSGYAGVGLVKGQTQSGNGNGNVSKNEWIRTMMVGYTLMEDVLRRYVTGGRWIEVKMEPKIRIMRKLD